MDATSWAALFGLLGSAIAAFRWLMQVNENKNIKIEELRKENMVNVVGRLEAAVESQRKDMELSRVQMTDLKRQLGILSVQLKDSTGATNTIIKSLKDFVDRAEKQFVKHESELIRLGKELIMVKGKKSES